MAAYIKKKRASSSSLFLTELMVAILFFSLAATLCITIFVKAHLLSQSAVTLNHAINISSDAAEIIRTADSMTQVQQQLSRLYPDATSTVTADSGDWTVYFDDEYYPMDSKHYTQYETIKMSEKNGLISAKITFFDETKKEVYSLDIDHTIREVAK